MEETAKKKTSRFKNGEYSHSRKCTWSGLKGARYTVTKGECKACDRAKIANAKNSGALVPKNAYGMDSETRNRLYCLKSRIVQARCTKYTNPSCACGKLVLNQLPYEKRTAPLEYL